MLNWFTAFLFRHRVSTLCIAAAFTALFAFAVPRVDYRTIYADLLPVDDPFVRTFFEHQDSYGSPLTVQMILLAPAGSIYDTTFLGALDRATREFETVPGINKERIFSLASRRVKTVRTDGTTIYSDPLLPPGRPLPRTAAELADLRFVVESTPGIVGIWVALDGSAALVQGSLIPGQFDHPAVLARLQDLQSELQQKFGVESLLLGEPVLTGWIYSYGREVLAIMLLSVVLMVGIFAAYVRHARLVVLSTISSLASAVWGLGLLGLLDMNLDPLILVVPLLILARSLSHSIQMGLRYQELLAQGLSRAEAGTALFKKQFPPGALGVVIDALGIFIIATAAIPLMDQLALFCGFCALSALVTPLLVVPLIVTFLNVENPRLRQDAVRLTTQAHPVLDFLSWLAAARRPRPYLWTAAGLLAAFGIITSTRLSIGNPQPGSPLLWPDSEFNRAVATLNERFVGSEDLVIVAEAAEGEDIREEKYIRAIADLQQRLEGRPEVAGSISFVDLLPQIRRKLWGNHPKTELLPLSTQESATYTEMLLQGASPGDFDRFFDRQYRHAGIQFFLKDRTAGTVQDIVHAAESITAAVEKEYGLPPVFRLALGTVGLQHAINREVRRADKIITFGVIALMLLACWMHYRSVLLAVILVTPLVLTHVIVLGVMTLMDIGLDVNTLPIAAVGMGIGIDYGIYLLSRIIEEVRAGTGNGTLESAVRQALHTTGGAIWVTATTMIGATGVWYFLSNLRFQAEMGLLLALIMFINLVGALVLVPLQINSFARGAILKRIRRLERPEVPARVEEAAVPKCSRTPAMQEAD